MTIKPSNIITSHQIFSHSLVSAEAFVPSVHGGVTKHATESLVLLNLIPSVSTAETDETHHKSGCAATSAPAEQAEALCG